MIGGEDVRPERRCPKTGIRLADSLLELQCHPRQMRRIAAGKPVEVTLSGAALEAQRGHRGRKGKLVDSRLKPPFVLERAAAD